MPLFDQIEHAGMTDVGIRRSHNQDAFAIQKAPDRARWKKEGHILIVADGMGGHAVGEKASAKAVQDIPLAYLKYVANEGPISAIRKSFQEANHGIYAIGQENPEFRGMGTTASVLVMREEGAWIGHVGDSRIYRVRDGQIEQLTFDHSYVWEMARRMGVSPEELEDVRKNVIIRSLGPDVLVQVDVEGPHPLHEGDTFVICSDGLSNPVLPEEIGAIASNFPPQEAARILIELANLRGGPDNVSAVVVRVGDATSSLVDNPNKNKKSFVKSLKNARDAWGRIVPWPITCLLLGLLFATGFILTMVNNVFGQTIFFTLSLIALISGGVLLFLESRKKKKSDKDDKPRKLNIYREYPATVDEELLAIFKELQDSVFEQVKDRPLDWALYNKLSKSADHFAKEQDLVAAFRDRLRALMLIAKPFNQTRQKEEGFKPKWVKMSWDS
ncbi:serine/threonine-protein phosphatase [Telmatocola sphagniphila]|uniref:Serine/threonine-protein phosphatase n=1 Tax=Telmatocola sphagniphila TaxID=1123043 RepID=A0A8E6B2S1_9BACT|nr:protein phosphatase 2C domain-containing protein [Telmatocola sphagniphila]QVL30021.1 serine/threonine-protein phosphatase [Telmatocola sphagniphila]